MFAARGLAGIFENVAGILAVEWLATSQGMDFREPLRSSDLLESAKQVLRDQVPFYDKDRYFSPDIEKATALINAGSLSKLLPEDLLGF